MSKSRRRQKTRPRRRRTTRRRRKTRRGGNKNIFKKYEKRLDAPYFKNKLYFPKEGKGAETYTKSLDRVITGWMREVVERTGAAWWRGGTELYNTSELTTRETADLKNAISRCMVEILYDKIRSHKNFVSRRVLQCMGIAAFLVAGKAITEYDWDGGDPWLATGAYLTDGACSKEVVAAMELDMLKTTDWRTCYKVQKRLGDEIAKGNIPFDAPEHRLWTAAEVHEQGVVPHITLTPAQLRTHQRRYDAGRKIVPAGWEKVKSRKTGEEYYRNIANPKIAQFEHPILEGTWYQSSPGSETWIEGASPDTKTALAAVFAPPPPPVPLRRKKSAISEMVDQYERNKKN